MQTLLNLWDQEHFNYYLGASSIRKTQIFPLFLCTKITDNIDLNVSQWMNLK